MCRVHPLCEPHRPHKDMMMFYNGNPKFWFVCLPEYEIIAMFGAKDMDDPNLTYEAIPYKRVEGLNRMLFSLRQLIGNCRFSIDDKKDRELKGVNLGDIAQEVLSKYESQLKEKIVPLSTIKWISETSVDEESVGFTAKDFRALYKKIHKGKMGKNWRQ